VTLRRWLRRGVFVGAIVLAMVFSYFLIRFVVWLVLTDLGFW